MSILIQVPLFLTVIPYSMQKKEGLEEEERVGDKKTKIVVHNSTTSGYLAGAS
jgi:hypothetical protein